MMRDFDDFLTNSSEGRSVFFLSGSSGGADDTHKSTKATLKSKADDVETMALVAAFQKCWRRYGIRFDKLGCMAHQSLGIITSHHLFYTPIYSRINLVFDVMAD